MKKWYELYDLETARDERDRQAMLAMNRVITELRNGKTDSSAYLTLTSLLDVVIEESLRLDETPESISDKVKLIQDHIQNKQ